MIKSASHLCLAPLLAAALAAPAMAAPVDWTCNAPTGEASELSQPVAGTLSIGGVITAQRFRPGKSLPVGGARISSADGKSVAVFQLLIPNAKPTELEARIMTLVAGQAKTYRVGTVPVGKPDPQPFSFSVVSGNKVALMLGGKPYSVDFTALAAGRAAVFCSGGQYTFNTVTLAPEVKR